MGEIVPVSYPDGSSGCPSKSAGTNHLAASNSLNLGDVIQNLVIATYDPASILQHSYRKI